MVGVPTSLGTPRNGGGQAASVGAAPSGSLGLATSPVPWEAGTTASVRESRHRRGQTHRDPRGWWAYQPPSERLGTGEDRRLASAQPPPARWGSPPPPFRGRLVRRHLCARADIGADRRIATRADGGRTNLPRNGGGQAAGGRQEGAHRHPAAHPIPRLMWSSAAAGGARGPTRARGVLREPSIHAAR